MDDKPKKSLTFRLDPELHHRFKTEALRAGRSMESLLRSWVTRYTANRENEK